MRWNPIKFIECISLRNLIRGSFCFYFVLGLTNAASAVSLKDACQEALNHSNVLASSKATLESAHEKLKATKAGYGPTLDVFSNVGLIDQRPKLDDSTGLTSNNWTSAAGLTLNWTVWDGGIQTVKEQSDAIAFSVAEMQSLQKSWDVLRDVGIKYLALFKALNSIASYSEKSKILERQKSTIERKVKNGLAPQMNLLEIEGQLQKQEALGISLQRTLKSARSELMVAVGSQTILGQSIETMDHLDPPHLTSPKVFAWDQTISSKLMKLEESSSAASLRALELDHGPHLDLGTSVDWGTSQFVGTGQSPSDNRSLKSSIQLSLKYRIWDWGQREHQKAGLLATQKSEALTREQQRLEGTAKIEDLFAEGQSIEAQRRANLKLFEMEKRKFDVMEQNYRTGLQSYLDLVTSIDSLSASRQSVDDDQVSIQLNAMQLHYVAGSLYEAILGS